MEKLSKEEEKFIKGIKGTYYKKIKDKKHLKNALRLLIRKSNEGGDILTTSVYKLNKFIDYVYDNNYTAFAMDMCVKEVSVFLAEDLIDDTMGLLERGNDFYKSKSLLPDVVYHTKNYNIFKFSKLNRGVNKSHVKKLSKSISADGLTQPIVVDSNLTVLDGQHRLSACKSLGIKVAYMLSEKKTSQARIITVNSVSKSWSSMDYLKSYAAAKKPDYIVFLKYMKKYGTSLPVTLRIFGVKLATLKKGEMKLKITPTTDVDFEFINTYADGHSAFNNRLFVPEILKFLHHDQFDEVKFGRQITKYPTWLSRSYKDLPDVRKDIRRIMTFNTKDAIVKIFNRVEFDIING